MYNFKQIEEEAQKLISKKDIEKAVSNDRKRKKLFSFLEGPPTANAPPGLHHLEVRTYKDIINKFRYMRGYNVPRKAGWDCHGLPVEVQIEKKLGLNSKKDIIKHGEERFIKECRQSVFSYIESWNKSTEKLGYWIDLKNPYVTLNNEYIESVWWSLKELYNKKLLYEAHKVVPYCPRCETPLSSHEVAQGYKDVKEESVYIAFKIKNKPGEYILAWTTTPWTLPGNVALAVGPEINYVKIKLKDGDYLILGKDRLNVVRGDYKIIEEFKGRKLKGIEYEPLYSIKELKNENSYKIILADFVSTQDGTGVVHTAGMYGEDDYSLCKANNLPLVHTVDENGKFNELVSQWNGKFVKSVETEIKNDLQKRGLLYKREFITHAYPFCWRCDSPLLYYAINSWFIKVTDYKKKLIELNKKINWEPKHIRDGRFGDWLENVRDWALSRKKFWGTPLPVWRCECGNEEIIGSVDELKKRSLRKISDKEIDLHKPWIDEIEFKCLKCKKNMRRIPDVIDCWYDSGSATFAQFHYPFDNKEEFKKRVPYDFISEAIDQTRGWFYTLHVLSTILFNDIAYKNVICAGHIVDENGEKMSKSKGNILNPDNVIDEVGVDATRIQFCTTDIGSSKRFGVEIVKKESLQFLNILWNTYQFYIQMQNDEKAKEKIEDKWIISRLNSIIKESTENLENYKIESALEPLIKFIVNDFSKTYIKIIRDREDKNANKVIGEVLDKVSRILAPYAPNMPEIIHKSFGKESVHLSSWPKHDEKKINLELEEDFNEILKIIELGLAERDRLKIGLKWPLAEIKILTDKKIPKELHEIIMNQLQVKKIKIEKSAESRIEFDERITPELESEGYARNIARQIQSLRKKNGMVKNDKIDLIIYVNKNVLKFINSQKEFIKKRTNSKNILISEDEKKNPGFSEDKIEIKGNEIKIYIKKVK